jgi:crotonobetainyl-CoA:carnitine CoA-transferase CaiB-like acyl-CoA transferase
MYDIGVVDFLQSVKYRCDIGLVDLLQSLIRLFDFTGPPVRFSDFPRSDPKAPPTLGQHTDHVMKNILKLKTKEIEQLRGERVIQ